MAAGGSGGGGGAHRRSMRSSSALLRPWQPPSMLCRLPMLAGRRGQRQRESTRLLTVSRRGWVGGLLQAAGNECWASRASQRANCSARQESRPVPTCLYRSSFRFRALADQPDLVDDARGAAASLGHPVHPRCSGSLLAAPCAVFRMRRTHLTGSDHHWGDGERRRIRCTAAATAHAAAAAEQGSRSQRCNAEAWLQVHAGRQHNKHMSECSSPNKHMSECSRCRVQRSSRASFDAASGRAAGRPRRALQAGHAEQQVWAAGNC